MTGLYIVVLGLPFLIAFGAVILAVRPYLRRPPGGLTKVVVGMIMMMTGALGFDFLSNFLTPGSWPATMEIYIEESLEMVGSTVILWGSFQLLTDVV